MFYGGYGAATELQQVAPWVMIVKGIKSVAHLERLMSDAPFPQQRQTFRVDNTAFCMTAILFNAITPENWCHRDKCAPMCMVKHGAKSVIPIMMPYLHQSFS